MKSFTLITTFVFGLFLTTLANTEESRTITVDTEKSTIAWIGKKVTGAHDGLISLKDGTMTFKNDELSGGTFTIDMKSLTVEDIENAGMNKKLLGHLKADDFFNVKEFETASLTITDVIKTTEAADDIANIKTYEVTADLTIKGITKPVTFISNVVFFESGRIEARGKIEVDRTAYGSVSKRGKSVGGNMVYNHVKGNVFVVAKD